MYAHVQNHQQLGLPAGKCGPMQHGTIATLAKLADIRGNAAPSGEFGPTLLYDLRSCFIGSVRYL